MKTFVSLLSMLLMAGLLSAQQVSIIPKPLVQEAREGQFKITAATRIVTSEENQGTADFLNSYLKEVYGFALPVVREFSGAAIRISSKSADGKEGYVLESGTNGINITGESEAGSFYGMQTLIQLLPVKKSNSLTIPGVYVKDEPRFSYRGMHLDVSRHFFSVSFIKKYIDYLALHKMNRFHWHLTDDQGWRIEIKKYPRLTQVGAWRNGTLIGRFPGTGNDGLHYGGYYTQTEVKEVVEYASKRFITVVPEIEMPGHASAAIAAFPILSCFPFESTQPAPETVWAGDTTGKHVQQAWGVFEDVFCAGKETTFKILEDVLDEVITLFPSKLIHIGGDECPKENWKRCALCQQRMKENNLKDEHELQSYFVQRMEKYLNSKGREIIGWDEILEGGLAPNAAVMSWRGEEGGIEAANQGHDVVMTPGGWLYFDHTQSLNEDSVTFGGYNPIEKVYGYEPVPSAIDPSKAKHILGAQANIWTEYVKNNRKVEYSLFPRAAALSEVQWSAKENKNWSDFEARLMNQFKRYDLWKANYSLAFFDLTASVGQSENGNIVWNLSSKLEGSSIQYATHKDGTTVSTKAQGTVYKTPIVVKHSTALTAWIKGGIPVTQTFSFSKSTGKKITLTEAPSKGYPGDGPFTLVNAVVNQKGMARSREFLGWEGKDCEAIIDFGKEEDFSKVVVHTLSLAGSWIYAPKNVTIQISNDGVNFTNVTDQKLLNNFPQGKTMEVNTGGTKARFVKVKVENIGKIPTGKPGAGHGAWLFIDEIQVF